MGSGECRRNIFFFGSVDGVGRWVGEGKKKGMLGVAYGLTVG